jgi:hypothetical protein
MRSSRQSRGVWQAQMLSQWSILCKPRVQLQCLLRPVPVGISLLHDLTVSSCKLMHEHLGYSLEVM